MTAGDGRAEDPAGGRAAAPFSTRSPRRINGEIADRIGSAIVRGAHGPGTVLPGEVAFAERTRVSRTAYREALRLLSAKGLVESRPRIGTRVCARERWNLLDPDIVRWFFETGDPPEFFLRGLYELRQIVEPAAARLAALRRSEADLAAIGAALGAMKSQTLATPAGRDADRRFHAGILRATQNAVLISLASGIGAAVNWTTAYKFRHKRLPRDPIPGHEAVLARIAARDPGGAAAAMEDLVAQALNDIRLTMTA